MWNVSTSSAFDFFTTGDADLGETSPNKVTAAFTDWNGARVSISPTSDFGEIAARGEPGPFSRVAFAFMVKPFILSKTAKFPPKIISLWSPAAQREVHCDCMGICKKKFYQYLIILSNFQN